MAKLSESSTKAVFELQIRMCEIIYHISKAKYVIFEEWKETESTSSTLEELTNMAQRVERLYSGYVKLMLAIAETQPALSENLLKLVEEVIERTEELVFVTEGSLQEALKEWGLL